MEAIQKILTVLQISTKECETYLFLLKNGPKTVSLLSKQMNLPRASLYGFLEKLQKKGLIHESIRLNTKLFVAESPEKINMLLQQKKANLEKEQNLFLNFLPQLKKQSFASKFSNPRFEIYEGKEGIKHVLKDMLLYDNLETHSWWPISDMLQVLGRDFFIYLNKKRVINKLYTRAIWPEQKIVSIQKNPFLGIGKKWLREIRIAPSKINFSMGYWIYGNRTAFISSDSESFGFIIESYELREMLLSQFEVLWEMSKKLKS